MFLYELVFLIRQDVSQSQAQTLADHFKHVVEDNGGKVHKLEYAGLKTLAYKIKKNKKAHYILMNLECPASALDEVQRQMRLDEDLLRHLSIRVETLDPNPSALVQTRGSYRDRDDQDRGSRYGSGDQDASASSAAPAPAPAESVA